MKHIFNVLLVLMIALSSHSLLGKEKKERNWKELKKKTIINRCPKYTLRYDPDEWGCNPKNRKKELWSRTHGFDILLSSNTLEKNQTTQELIDGFHEAVTDAYNDPKFFCGVEFLPEEMVSVNGVELLRLNAIISLVPESIHVKCDEKGGYTKRWVSENGAQDQLEMYMHSDASGTISVYYKSLGLISEEKQACIDSLLAGFSLDGSACRGPKLFRGIKTTLEAVLSSE